MYITDRVRGGEKKQLNASYKKTKYTRTRKFIYIYITNVCYC